MLIPQDPPIPEHPSPGHPARTGPPGRQLRRNGRTARTVRSSAREKGIL